MALVGDNGAGQVDADQVRRGDPLDRQRRGPLRGQARARSTARRTPPSSGSRSSTRISRSATTSTSSRTCTSAARSTTCSSASRRRAMEQRTSETLASLSVTTIRSVRQPVATLSGGQRQSVAVARAVMWNSRVVILDEPTAALGVAQTRQVLDAREAARRAGPRRRHRLPQPRTTSSRWPTGSPSCGSAATSASTSGRRRTQQEIVAGDHGRRPRTKVSAEVAA